MSELAAKAGADERALGKLLRYLHALDVLTETQPDHYALTPVGEGLTLEFMIEHLHPAGVGGREMLGILGLTESIRTGQASYATVTGQNFAEVRAEQDYEDRYLERLARFQASLAEPIAKSDILTGVEHLVIHSGGAGAQAREFLAVHPDLRITICAPPRPGRLAAPRPTGHHPRQTAARVGQRGRTIRVRTQPRIGRGAHQPRVQGPARCRRGPCTAPRS